MAMDRADLRDEDRLPWLETVEPDEEPRSGAGRTIALGLLALALIGAAFAVVAVWRQNRLADGGGALIAAERGAYKVRPDDPGGLRVEGEGEAAVAASGGAVASDASVDLGAVPEVPVAASASAGRPPAEAGAAAGRIAVAQVPAPGGRLIAAPPLSASRIGVPGGIGGGSLVQLGAFPTEAAANASWGAFAKRFGYLAALGRSVEKAEVNGRIVYRLRVNAGSVDQASDICGRLRVAGESCFVTS